LVQRTVEDQSNLPSNYWVKELKTCLKKTWPPPSDLPFTSLHPDDIDPNASAWKIVFVVKEYQSKEGKQSYKYTGSSCD
jgi:hypothetical protein